MTYAEKLAAKDRVRRKRARKLADKRRKHGKRPLK